MHVDPALPVIVSAVLAILLIGFALRALRQPQIVGYLVASLATGPFGLGLARRSSRVRRLVRADRGIYNHGRSVFIQRLGTEPGHTAP